MGLALTKGRKRGRKLYNSSAFPVGTVMKDE